MGKRIRINVRVNGRRTSVTLRSTLVAMYIQALCPHLVDHPHQWVRALQCWLDELEKRHPYCKADSIAGQVSDRICVGVTAEFGDAVGQQDLLASL